MTHSAKVIADSISPDGVRLTTVEATFPRIVLAEFNTHRMFSRNSASSRAIPVEKMIRMVEEHPYIPTHWGKNQKGMQAEEEIVGLAREMAEEGWLFARDNAVIQARHLLEIGVHKQITNRLLEPFMWHTVIVTATEWSNFFNLRCNKHAHPEIKLVAELMRDAMAASDPKQLGYGDWHLPYVRDEDYQSTIITMPTDPLGVMQTLVRVSSGRCARVSYLTHDGRRAIGEDIALHDRLLASGHMSPFEHVARPMKSLGGDSDLGLCNNADAFDGSFQAAQTFCGNFRGWVQYRKLIAGEDDILEARAAELVATQTPEQMLQSMKP